MLRRKLSLFIVTVALVTCLLGFASAGKAFAAVKVGKIKGLQVSSVTTTSCKIRWTKQKRVTGYKVYLKKCSGSYKLTKTLKATSYTQKKLASNTKYSVKVRAYLKKGKKTIYGQYSVVKTFTTKKAKKQSVDI